MSKILLIFTSILFISCQTNIIEGYSCEGKEELVSRTYIECIAADKERPKEQATMKHNSVYACKNSVKELFCKPIYKKIEL